MILHKPQNVKKYNKENKTPFLECINCGFIYAQRNWVHKKRFLEELKAISDQKAISDLTRDSFLLLLFYQIKRSTEQNSVQHMIIKKFSNYIENNITKPLTAQMVADALKYNKDYLSRVIKKYYGISLIDYINKRKINLAKSINLTVLQLLFCLKRVTVL